MEPEFTEYNLESIQIIYPGDNISDSVDTLNYNYNALYVSAVGIQNDYNKYLYEIIEYYKDNSQILFDGITLYSQNSANWEDFLTVTKTYSGSWLQPLTVFYPNIIKYDASNSTTYPIDDILAWLKTYFPIKNSDGTLNYVENQKFIVTAYVHESGNRLNLLAQPFSYCNCSTTAGKITLHCQTIITGGVINCNQGSYNCNRTINCYPSKNVDCWYENPYLKPNFSPIAKTDPVSEKRNTVSRINARIQMQYQDKYEKNIEQYVFMVRDCDWVHTGAVAYT